MVETPDDRQAGQTKPAPVPHPWDAFLTGPENELAFAGAQALARGEREGISPLVVHGLSGVGKSRLLAGLVLRMLAQATGCLRCSHGRDRLRRSLPGGRQGSEVTGAGWSEFAPDSASSTCWFSMIWRASSAPPWRTMS